MCARTHYLLTSTFFQITTIKMRPGKLFHIYSGPYSVSRGPTRTTPPHLLLFLLFSVSTDPLHGHSNQAQLSIPQLLCSTTQAGHVGPLWRGATVNHTTGSAHAATSDGTGTFKQAQCTMRTRESRNSSRLLAPGDIFKNHQKK